MTHRQRRRMRLVAAAVVAGLLPMLLFSAIGWWQAAEDTEARRYRYAGIALARAERIFASADHTLHDLAGRVDPSCTPRTLAALQSAEYNSLYVRQAGLIFDGALRCAGSGVLTTPTPIELPEGLRVPASGMLIATPSAKQSPEASIRVLYRVADGVALELSINPAQLGDALDELMAREQVEVTLYRSDGAALTRFGWQAPGKGTAGVALRSTTLESTVLPIRLVAATPHAWIWQAWRHSAAVFGSIAFAISALLFLVGNMVRRQFSIDAELRDALVHDEFRVFYQPIVDAVSGECAGCEALLRWQHPTRGLLLPDVFVPLAQETGFVKPLTEWLIRRVKEEMTPLLNTHPRMHVSMNLSARHVLDPALLTAIRETFDEDLPARRVVFEITEQELLSGDHEALVDVLEQIRATGARLALDDFGTGYSSLKYLTQFRFDFLKIDKVFIDAIGTDSITTGLVDAIVDIARRLKLIVIAEGVETPGQLEYLRARKVPLVQGWRFSKALTPAQLRGFVNRQIGSSRESLPATAVRT